MNNACVWRRGVVRAPIAQSPAGTYTTTDPPPYRCHSHGRRKSALGCLAVLCTGARVAFLLLVCVNRADSTAGAQHRTHTIDQKGRPVREYTCDHLGLLSDTPLSTAKSICDGVDAFRSGTRPSFAMATFNDSVWCSADDFVRNAGRMPDHNEITHLFDALLRHRENCVVVDVGCNVGWFTLQAASLGCSVTAFELQPRLHGLLNVSMRLNPGFGERVRSHQLAIENRTRSVSVFGSSHRYMGSAYIGSSVAKHTSGRAIIVQSARLDDMLSYEGGIDLLKASAAPCMQATWSAKLSPTLAVLDSASSRAPSTQTFAGGCRRL